MDLSVFDKRYNNDETGAPAYDPRILLKLSFSHTQEVSHPAGRLPSAVKKKLFSWLYQDNAPENFAVLRHIVLNLLKNETPDGRLGNHLSRKGIGKK